MSSWTPADRWPRRSRARSARLPTSATRWRWTRSGCCSATSRSPATSCWRRRSWRSIQVSGYGGSDLTPAMERLAADPQVRAAAIITDGEISTRRSPCRMRSSGSCPQDDRRLQYPRMDGSVVMDTVAGSAMKVIQELVAHFERQKKLSRGRDPRPARSGAARLGGALADPGPVRHARHHVLLPRHRRDRRDPCGARTSTRATRRSPSRQCTPAPSRPARPRSSA
jgi:hypothetical protein